MEETIKLKKIYELKFNICVPGCEYNINSLSLCDFAYINDLVNEDSLLMGAEKIESGMPCVYLEERG